MARKYCEENERTKRKYLLYLKHAKGQDHKSLDKSAAAVLKFEQSTNYKPFKNFHIDQAVKFKTLLSSSKNMRTKKPLSFATVDATLRLVKNFFHWLAGQSGYKSRISYPDVEYFNNNSKNARIANTKRDVRFPSLEQAEHAFQAMPDGTDIEKRDKALFAFSMLTGARDGAIASLKLKHINLFDGYVFQDARDVNTKNSKTITTWFFPVDHAYLDTFETWVKYLKEQKLFSEDDPLFPKPERKLENGQFQHNNLSRDHYANSAKINAIIKVAFTKVQLPPFTPHLFRKTLAVFGDQFCTTMEQRKAWSLNLGHEHLSTTINSYIPVSRQRQGELIKNMRKATH